MKKNLTKTAKKLKVSPKTLQLYIEKIKEQTGMKAPNKTRKAMLDAEAGKTKKAKNVEELFKEI
jgi:hypothetical protein